MMRLDIIETILRDSNYHLGLFSADETESLREKVFIKTARGKEIPCITCVVQFPRTLFYQTVDGTEYFHIH